MKVTYCRRRRRPGSHTIVLILLVMFAGLEIATSWEVSPDGKTWTFKIRERVKWHDGVPLTAKDVAFTFNYIVDNNLLNLAIYTGGITGATAIDDTTVEITIVKPKSNMLATFVSIIPEHIWSKVGGKEASTTYANPMPIVGSGPFQVVEWQKGKFIRLNANQEYWGGAPKIDELFFENCQSADTMVADLKVGATDAATRLPQSQVPILKQTAGMTVLKGTFFCFNELGFNCDDSPYSQGNPMPRDATLLHALNWAIDRQKIVDVWTADIDPEAQLGVLTPLQIEGWSDTLWTDPEHTRVFAQQEQPIDVA